MGTNKLSLIKGKSFHKLDVCTTTFQDERTSVKCVLSVRHPSPDVVHVRKHTLSISAHCVVITKQ